MTKEEILEKLSSDAMLLEPREHYDDALVGAVKHPKDNWTREGELTVALYSYAKCLEVIARLLDAPSDSDAPVEWFWQNTSGAWVGEGTPAFDVCVLEEEEDPHGSSG